MLCAAWSAEQKVCRGGFDHTSPGVRHFRFANSACAHPALHSILAWAPPPNRQLEIMWLVNDQASLLDSEVLPKMLHAGETPRVHRAWSSSHSPGAHWRYEHRVGGRQEGTGLGSGAPWWRPGSASPLAVLPEQVTRASAPFLTQGRRRLALNFSQLAASNSK